MKDPRKPSAAISMTHLHRFLLVYFGLLSLLGMSLLSGCAKEPSPQFQQERIEEQRMLEKDFLHWRQDLQSNDWEEVVQFLSADSKRWLVEIAQSSRRDDSLALKDKAFEDVVFILALRVDRRKSPSLDDRPEALVARLFEPGSPVRKAFLNAELGMIRSNGEVAELALREDPGDPVFFFVKEGLDWNLDWRKTIPLIMHSAEKKSRSHGKNKLAQAIWLLQNWGDREVYPEDLVPRGG